MKTKPNLFKNVTFMLMLAFLLAVFLPAVKHPVYAAGNPQAATNTVYPTHTALPTYTSPPSSTPTVTLTATPTPSPTASLTATLGVSASADPQAWLDLTGVDLLRFQPNQPVVVRFNTPMDAQSASAPLLFWPDAAGSATWDMSFTVLTFLPADKLLNDSSYTFFVNPALRAQNGKALTDAPEWRLQTLAGLRQPTVYPAPGLLDRHIQQFQISFGDQIMDTTLLDGLLVIEPAIPFKVSWKRSSLIFVQLDQPLAVGERYTLTLNKKVAGLAGITLDKDYTWFYEMPTPAAEIVSTGNEDVVIEFNYALDREKTGLGLRISPDLEGAWEWKTSNRVVFNSKSLIPGNQKFTVSFPAWVDASGFNLPAPAPVIFSGPPPMRLLEEDGLAKSKYDLGAMLYANQGLKKLHLEFDGLVNHASAEKAFSISPAVPGKISWQANAQGKETLIYTFTEELKAETVYVVRVAETLTDTHGKPFAGKPFENQIQTSFNYWRPNIFGVGGADIQVVDADGSRRIQINQSEDVAFTAYRFDLIDFAAQYAKYGTTEYRYYTRGLKIPIPDNLKPSATWTGVYTRTVGDTSINELILPAALEPGLYVLAAQNDAGDADQLWVVISQNTLLVKEGQSETQVWVTNINGQPVANAEIRIYDSQGAKIREGETDESGFYRVPLTEAESPMLVSARVRERGKPDDVTVAGFNNPWDTTINDNYDYDNDPTHFLPWGQAFMVYPYTERPIYRPGQTVNFKVVLRKDDDVRYSLPPAGSPVTVYVQDARQNTIQTMTLRTNQFGTVNGSFSISSEAVLGSYDLTAEIEGISEYVSFQVEDYRKPEYQVTLTSLQPEKAGRYVTGDEVKVGVNVSYYFGEPLANIPLKVDAFIQYGYPISNFRIESRTVTDAEGNATLIFNAPNPAEYASWSRWRPRQTIRLQVTADNGNNQPVTSFYYFDVYPSVDQLTLETGGHYFKPGANIQLQIKDLDLDEKPVSNRSLDITLRQWSWTDFEMKTTQQKFTVVTDAQGNASQSITLEKGYYEIIVAGTDDRRNRFYQTTWVYVFKDANDWESGNREGILAITTEKDRYKPYEKAKLVIESSFSGPALLTFERGSVINNKPITLTAPLTVIETEIIPEHAPNVFITVNAWEANPGNLLQHNWYGFYSSMADSYMRVAHTYVEVDASAKALDITITPAQPVYKPGETARLEIQVKQADGSPVRAELSLAVVDEAIFALADPHEADIFDAFYGPRNLSVYTYDSMSPYRILEEEGGRGGGGDTVPGTPRTDFRDTSTWVPVIETDPNGKATVEFKLPDNTTRWRLIVKAVTLESQVGQAQAYIETKKELFVNPVLPRILTQGDTAHLVTFVHNYSGAAQVATVSLEADGVELLVAARQQVTIAAGQALPVSWRVRVSGSKPGQVTFRVTGAGVGLDDAVQLPLPIRPASAREVWTQSGQVSGIQTLTLNLPQVDRESSRVTLSLNRNLSGTLLQGLEFLTGYPYGCVEQTMSRALPNAVVANAERQLGLGTGLNKTLPPLIRASLDKFYALQHVDGGWGWWADDISDPYQTAWVLFGLSVIRDSGYEVSENVLKEGAGWLSKKVKDEDDILDPRIRAYALYSLARAGYGERDATLQLADEQGVSLDPFSQATLAMALDELGEKKQALAMLDLLEKNAVSQGDQAYWPQSNEDGEYHRKAMSSTLRTTAMALLAYNRLDPKSPLIPGAVNYLASRRRGSEGWGTTNETSYTILALTEYLKTQTAAQQETPYKVVLNGQTLAEGVLGSEQPGLKVEIPLSGLNNGANRLELESDAETPLYFDLVTAYYRTQVESEALGEINVTRSYTDTKSGITTETLPLGGLIKVTLKLDVPKDVSYFALEDYLPGGLEALNEHLNATQENLDGLAYAEYGMRWFFWEEYGYNYKEIRGDRVVFFFTQLRKGTHTFTYLARATTQGRFIALPVQAYAMYDVTLWGRSGGTVLEIK